MSTHWCASRPVLRAFGTSILLAALVAVAGFASGEDYPSKSIRIVAPGVGGSGDFVSRLIAQGISGPLGQQVIVDNKPTGVIQAEAVYKAAPDGYTLLVAGGSVWIFPLLRKTVYDVVRDFSPITMVERAPLLLAVHASLPVKSVKELIELAKSRPGALNYSTTGIGSSFHLAAELFKAMTGVDFVHVAYNGSGTAVSALIAGEVQLQFGSPTALTEHVKSGRLRALAVTSAEPSILVPGMPTIAASGLPGYEVIGITGMWAPVRTPPAIVNRLNQEIARVLNRDDIRQTLLKRGSEAVGGSPEQLAAAIEADVARMGEVIRNAGIRAE
jgi:tripartite-type tricarboxylate transporter receptor subunit TctC